MHRWAVVFLLLPVMAGAQHHRNALGFTAERTDLGLSILNNSGVKSRSGGYGLGVFYHRRPTAVFSWSGLFSAGRLTEWSEDARPGSSATCLRADAGISLLPQALFANQDRRRFRIPLKAGYTLQYWRDATGTGHAGNLAVAAGYGAGLEYDFKNWGLVCSVMHHQRLNMDFRTFLTARMGLTISM